MVIMASCIQLWTNFAFFLFGGRLMELMCLDQSSVYLEDFAVQSAFKLWFDSLSICLIQSNSYIYQVLKF
jgi:hypothetical protein